MEEPQSLRSLFELAKKQKASLDEALETNTAEARSSLNDAISKFSDCQHRIAQLSLFSTNETLEDINTRDLQYLTVDYYLADLLQRAHTDDRLQGLRQARDEYEKFLESLDNYRLLSKNDKKLYGQFIENPSTFALIPANNPALRREVKISRLREEKQLKQQLEHYSQYSNNIQVDDEVVRKLYLAEIQLYVHETFQALDMLSQEINLLSMMQTVSLPDPNYDADTRRNNNWDNSDYSERLDIGLTAGQGKGGALLDQKGVPIRPFTLTNKRTELRQGVFRPSHNLPTMSIDEYLEEERRRGNIIAGGGESSGQPQVVDEDNIDRADEETMKAREWDEYKEANPRGSGNTLNRG